MSVHKPRAQHHLVHQVPIATAHESVERVLKSFHGKQLATIETVYVVDEDQVLLGTIPTRELYLQPPHTPMEAIMRRKFPYTHPEESQEQLAFHTLRGQAESIPVLDRNRHFLGVIPPRRIIEILRHEHLEDLHRLSGISPAKLQLLTAIEESPMLRLRARLPWLLVGLLGSVVATLVMTRYRQALEAQVVIAFFIPAIVYLADSIGTQTEAIAVRFLSVEQPALWRILLGELKTGLGIGIALSLFIFPAVYFGFGDAALALAVCTAVIAAGSIAAGMGLTLPWLLARAGKDPALGSGPVATIIQDVLSLLIYFAAISLLVL